jgi:hypothetical protein
MHRIQRFIEANSGRIGYALAVAALPDLGKGSRWTSDPSFSCRDTILDNPEFVSVLRVVLRDGHVIVPIRRSAARRMQVFACDISTSATGGSPPTGHATRPRFLRRFTCLVAEAFDEQ